MQPLFGKKMIAKLKTEKDDDGPDGIQRGDEKARQRACCG
jgi:hypothetical protein